jgi:hypothetical protein
MVEKSPTGDTHFVNTSLHSNYTRLSRGHCLLNRRTGSSGWVRDDNLWTKGLGWVERVECNFWYLLTARSLTNGTLRSL